MGIKINFTFLIAGLVFSKLLPAAPKAKIFGLNNRPVFTLGNAAFFALVEIFLVTTPTFVWVYPWWGVIPVFVTVYIPFFAAAFYVSDWPAQRQVQFCWWPGRA